MDTCGRRFNVFQANSTAHFEELSISATFPTPIVEDQVLQATNSAVFPLAVKPSIMPLESMDYEFRSSSSGNNTIFNLTLMNINEELYSFAVWGRRYATDGQDADPPVPAEGGNGNGAASYLLSKILLGPVLFLLSVWY